MASKIVERIREFLENADRAYSARDVAKELGIRREGAGRILPKLFEMGLVACRIGRHAGKKMTPYERFYAYKDRTRLLESTDNKKIIFVDNMVYVKEGFENDFQQTVRYLMIPIQSIKGLKKIH